MSWCLHDRCHSPSHDHLFVPPRRPRQSQVVTSENRHASAGTSSLPWLGVDPQGFPPPFLSPLGRRRHTLAAEMVLLAEDDVGAGPHEVPLQGSPSRRIGRFDREGKELFVGRAVNEAP
jgi:hypothetical protein